MPESSSESVPENKQKVGGYRQVLNNCRSKTEQKEREFGKKLEGVEFDEQAVELSKSVGRELFHFRLFQLKEALDVSESERFHHLEALEENLCHLEVISELMKNDPFRLSPFTADILATSGRLTALQKERLKPLILKEIENMLSSPYPGPPFGEILFAEKLSSFLKVLSVIDVALFVDLEERASPVLIKNLTSLNQHWDSLEEEGKTILEFSERLIDLYKVMSLQLYYQDRQECLRNLRETEAELLHKKQLIPDFISEQMRTFPDLRKGFSLETPCSDQLSSKLRVEDPFVYFDHDGQTWRISKHVEEEAITVSCVDDPRRTVIYDSSTLTPLLEKEQFETIVHQAEENARIEEEQMKSLRRYELPPEPKPIVYLRIFPSKLSTPQDNLIQDSLALSSMKAIVLEDRYTNLKALPVIFSDQPLQELRAWLSQQTEGTLFILDFYNHGLPEQISYGSPVTAQGLADLSLQFPQHQFTISTVACFGGGLADGLLEKMKEHPELKERLNLFVQTKPSMINEAGSISVPGDEIRPKMSTYYEFRLLWNLIQKNEAGEYLKTLGESLEDTDRWSKEKMDLNPEAIINNGERISAAPLGRGRESGSLAA